MPAPRPAVFYLSVCTNQHTDPKSIRPSAFCRNQLAWAEEKETVPDTNGIQEEFVTPTFRRLSNSLEGNR